jgi:signal transduction histidine kinase
VGTAADLAAALEREPWAVVICDRGLPSFKSDVTERRNERRKVRRLRRLNLELEQRVVERTRELEARTEEASRAWEEAMRASEEKTKFLLRLSHDLRTPLNSILGFAQLLELNLRSADEDSIERILQAGRHVLGLVNEIIDISRIEAGSLPLALDDLAVDVVVEDVLDVAEAVALERGVSVRGRFTSFVPHVLADRQRLTEALLNLVVNGIVYNREGGTVLVSCAPVEGGRVRIEVSDTGPGIASQDLPRLFTPFERLGRAGEEAGTGLGLALSRLLVEAMGGSVSVSSVLGEGTTFTVELPAAGGPRGRG